MRVTRLLSSIITVTFVVLALPFPGFSQHSGVVPEEKKSTNGSSLAASSSGFWSKGGDLNVARGLHTATVLNSGKILVVGGSALAFDNGDLSSAELYDPGANRWKLTGSLNAGRHGHSATLLPNGKVLVIGGTTATTGVRTSELYDPATESWTNVAALGIGRSNHSAVLLHDGTVFVTGGYLAGPSTQVLSIAEIYDPSTNSWRAAAGMPTNRAGHNAVVLPDGQVLVAGGNSSSNIPTNRVERYNPATNTWQTLNNLSISRAGHSVTLLQNGKVLVAGGFSEVFGPVASAELFDPANNIWTQTGSLSGIRSGHASVLLTSGKVLVAGNRDPDSSAEVYDPTTGSWSQLPGLRADRFSPTIDLLLNGKVLLTGGFVPNSRSALTDIFDPTASASPGPKIVFGSARNRNNDVYVMDADGNNQIRLTTHAAYDDSPKWSPDGSKIVFMSGRDGNFELYTMNADGSNQTRLTNNPASDGLPSWSPDGAKIVFVSGNLKDPSSFELFTINADGSNRTQLTNDSVVDATPSWSPDGSKIVFMSGSSIFDPNGFEIFVMNANGSNRVRLTNNNVADGQPSFSPNGRKILYASGNFMFPEMIEIMVMNADGSGQTFVTVNDVTDGFPAWSSNGTQIIYASGNINNEFGVELFVQDFQGPNVTKLTTNSALDWFPNYQPGPSASTFQVEPGPLSVNEGAGHVTATITRTDNLTTTASVSYFARTQTATVIPCDQVTGAASDQCDYLPVRGTATFAPGEASKSVSIPIVDDAYAEGPETFSFGIFNPVNATIDTPTFVTITITDNETVNGVNPIDTPAFFVRQHYLDFLSREPDAAGQQFWTNEITSCGADAQCLEVKRINVSAAFFLSIEFQETGYLVYRVHKSAFGNLPIPFTPDFAPVPVKYFDFLSGTQDLGRGLIVGSNGWEQLLETRKQEYLLAFVQDSKFLTAFPNNMSAEQFVTKLDANAGGVLSASEKSNLIAVLGATPDDVTKRSQVLRAVAEDADLKSAEFNKAFVLMQYFGYLRRDPDFPPDFNFDGYNFWLGKLNQFNGNFVDAELVKAFILSGEYRKRFGQ